MIIDAHTHILLDADRQDQTVADLLRSMDAAKIDRSAVFASSINGLPTKKLLDEIAAHRDRLIAVACCSPLKNDFNVPVWILDQWLEEGLVSAVKFYTGYEHFFPHDDRLNVWCATLAKHGKPAIFHMGDCYDKIPGALLEYAHPLQIDRLAHKHPKLKIIIAHLGQPWVLDAAQVCAKNKNVFTDCSGFVYGTFDERHERLFRAFWRMMDDFTYGAAHEKILFGSDWPICDMTDYVRLVKDLAGAQYEAIFSGNAQAVFGL